MISFGCCLLVVGCVATTLPIVHVAVAFAVALAVAVGAVRYCLLSCAVVCCWRVVV